MMYELHLPGLSFLKKDQATSPEPKTREIDGYEIPTDQLPYNQHFLDNALVIPEQIVSHYLDEEGKKFTSHFDSPHYSLRQSLTGVRERYARAPRQVGLHWLSSTEKYRPHHLPSSIQEVVPTDQLPPDPDDYKHQPFENEGAKKARYLVYKEPYGQGGMGEVYLAWDLKKQDFVIIKITRPKMEDVVGRDKATAMIRKEARLVASLKHPHLLQIHDVIEFKDTDAMVMDWLNPHNSVDIHYLIHERNVTTEKEHHFAINLNTISSTISQLSEVLLYLQSKGVTHKDLKPHNMFLTKDGLKLIDFSTSPNVKGWREEELDGTTAYFSPERFLFDDTFNPQNPDYLHNMEVSDIFSTAIIVFEMFTGRRLFPPDLKTAPTGADNDQDRKIWGPAEKILKFTGFDIYDPHYRDLLKILKRLGFKKDGIEEFNRVMKKALEPEPEDRYQSMAQFTTELNAVLLSVPDRKRTKVIKTNQPSLIKKVKSFGQLVQKKLRRSKTPQDGLLPIMPVEPVSHTVPIEQSNTEHYPYREQFAQTHSADYPAELETQPQ